MKRSKMLRLVLMGAAGSLIAGCGDDADDGYDISEDVTVYKSVQECVDKGVFTENFCKENFDKAKELHEKVAPRFTAQSACEAQFGPGGCEMRPADSSGGSVWLPAIAGFMLGQALGNRRSEVIYQPLYNSYSSGGSYGGGGGGGGSYGSYRTWNSPAPIRPNASGSARFDTDVLRGAASAQKPAFARTTTVARGGFGARASSGSSSSSFGG